MSSHSNSPHTQGGRHASSGFNDGTISEWLAQSLTQASSVSYQRPVPRRGSCVATREESFHYLTTRGKILAFSAFNRNSADETTGDFSYPPLSANGDIQYDFQVSVGSHVAITENELTRVLLDVYGVQLHHMYALSGRLRGSVL
jgi:hypothetical protein